MQRSRRGASHLRTLLWRCLTLTSTYTQLDQLRQEGFENVTHSVLERRHGVGEFLSQVATRTLRRPHRSASGIFKKLMRPFVLVLMEGVQRELEKASSCRMRITEDDMWATIGAELAIGSGVADDWFEDVGSSISISASVFNKIRGKFGKMEGDMLVRQEASLSAELSRYIRLGTYRVVDELVYKWSSHTNLTVFIPRKPHPVGHLFYELAVWVECPGHDEPLPYLVNFTFVFKGHDNHFPGPTAHAKMLVEKFGTDNALYVFDSAFGKPDLLDYLRERSCLFLAAVAQREVPNFERIALALGDGESLLWRSKIGDIYLLHYGEVESEKNANRVGSRIFSVTSSWKVKDKAVCHCNFKTTREEAELLMQWSLASLRSVAPNHANDRSRKPLTLFGKCYSLTPARLQRGVCVPTNRPQPDHR